MQTQNSTTESSWLSSSLLFETPPGDTGPIDPPDNTNPTNPTSTPAQPEEEETPESQ